MYQIAGVVGILRTILIIVLIYYVLRFISRFLLPIFLRSFFGRQGDYNQRDQGQGSQGRAESKRKKDTDLGEYVDFEEIKDKKDHEK